MTWMGLVNTAPRMPKTIRPTKNNQRIPAGTWRWGRTTGIDRVLAHSHA